MPVTTAAPLDPLLAADSATQRLAVAGLPIAEAVPEYVRHKPGETTIVSYRFTTLAGEEARGYVHWCADERRADELHAKALTLAPRATPLGDGVRRVDANTVLYAFPTDARLRRLRWYTTPRKLKRSLSMVAVGATPITEARRRVEILRYKPERRVVVRVDLTADATRRLLVRYTTGGGAAALAQTARRLRTAGLLVPAPIAQTESDRVGVDEFIDAIELRARVQAAPGTDHDLADGVADTLARLHTVVPPTDAGGRSAAGDLTAVESGLSLLADRSPPHRPAADRLVTELATRVPSATPPAMIHGDLHGKNLLVDEAGVWLIDLERVAAGPAEIDLGCLRGHGLSLGIRQPGWSPGAAAFVDEVVERYRRHRRVDGAALAWHTAIALTEQALLVSRQLHPGWPATSAALLEMALAEAGRAG